MKKILLFVLAVVFTANLNAQVPGAIAFIGVNGDNPDQFTFVVIDALTAGTEIFFTDSGILMNGNFRGNEGAVKYTVPVGGLAQGVVVSVTVTDGTNANFTASASTGTVVNANDATVGNNGFALSADGDQVIAFIGSTAMPTFIAAVQTNSNQFQTNATDANTSALPTGLVNGTTAVAVGAGSGDGDEYDNSQYTGSRGPFADRNTALTTINSNTGWTGNNNRITLNTADFTTPLPIELSYFNATATANNQVALAWGTESELNNDYMAIERSQDGQKFFEIGKVKGAGTTVEAQTYSFLDEAPKAGVNYYRIRQVDFDGTVEYHKVVAVSIKGGNSTNVYPTLVTTEVNVVLEGTANISIMDITGRMVKQVKGADFTTIDVADLAAGTYFLMIENNNAREAVRFVKR